jgi:N-acetylglucosaminyldiphosphoundecaprenol N-acetyl-beta-D-mannosaminyltransferase
MASDRDYPIAEKRDGAVEILGLTLHPVGVGEVFSFIQTVIRHGQKALVLHLNIQGVNLAMGRPWLKEFFNQAQLVFCDGDGVRWGAKILGLSVPYKITYDRWIWQLAAFCEKEDFRLFFLGGRSGVAEAAAGRLRGRYPGLKIAGFHHGYFDKKGSENERVIQTISQSKPDILIVGFGMPLQEKWLSENWRQISAHVFLAGGAVFDYASGGAKRAPQWMIQAQMEWLFRLIQEPRRLFGRYVFGIPYFFFRLLLEKIRRIFP